MMVEIIDKKSNVWKYALLIILISIPDVISYYATMAKIIPIITVRISMLSVFLLFFYCSFNNLSQYKISLLFCFILMMLTSLFHITPTMPILTVFSIGSLMFFGTFHKTMNLSFFNKAFTIYAVIFIPILIYKIIQSGLDMDILLRRGYAWTEIFAYGAVTNLWMPLMFSSVLLKKNIWVSFTFWALFFGMMLISVKRQGVVDTFIAFSIIIFTMRKLHDKKMVRRFMLALVPLVIIGIVAAASGAFSAASGDLYNAVNDRFSESTEDISSFDRFVESKDYFTKETGVIDVILGKGLLSPHYALAEEHYFLHIGWTNFIFKGGLFLFFVILLGYKKVFRVFLHPNRYSLELVFCSMYCVYYFFALFYGNMMGYGVPLLLFFYCLTQLNDNLSTAIRNVAIQ